VTLPDAFEARMRNLLGPEAEALFAALAAPPVAGLRVNALKLSPEEFAGLSPWPLTPLPWCSSGFTLPADTAPGKHPFHAAGLYYLQDPSAMAVAEALSPRPGERVLDLAAAPGGKSTHLLSLMGDAGLLVANEVNRGRAAALLENLERWGATNAVVVSAEVSRLADAWGATFDRVLLDAPCSGEGMFRKSEEALAHWSEANVAACAVRQRSLLPDAARLVKPGGVLVYSTCTFAPEENEQTVAAFLDTHPDFALELLSLPGFQPGRPEWASSSHALGNAARLWPHRGVGEGHFVARLLRTGGDVERPRLMKLPAPTPSAKLWHAFREATLPRDPAAGRALAQYGSELYALPEGMPDVRGLRVLRAGLWLGTLKTRRLEPSHALALALTREDAAEMNGLELPPDDPRALAYLQGSGLEAPGPDGWLVVTAAGFPLGWGKRSQGVINNHYPRGLRWR
jgi:NOL1/NOP2/sun family putative RNA methylase